MSECMYGIWQAALYKNDPYVKQFIQVKQKSSEAPWIIYLELSKSHIKLQRVVLTQQLTFQSNSNGCPEESNAVLKWT